MFWYIRNRMKKVIKESNFLSSTYASRLLTGTLCGCHGYCHLHAISKQLPRSNFTYYFQYFEAHHFLLCAKCMKQGNCLKFMCEKKDKWEDPDSDTQTHVESFRNRCNTSFNLAALLNNCEICKGSFFLVFWNYNQAHGGWCPKHVTSRLIQPAVLRWGFRRLTRYTL